MVIRSPSFSDVDSAALTPDRDTMLEQALDDFTFKQDFAP